MKEHVVKISMLKVQVFGGLVSLLTLFLTLTLHSMIHGEIVLTVTFASIGWFLIGVFGFIFLHEFFHLLGFKLFGKVGLNDIKWGFNLKMMVAHTHAKKPIPVHAMKKALFLPFIPTGMLPLLIGLSINELGLSLLGAILISGCIGDFILYQKLRSFDNHSLVMDHPTKPQFTVFER
ncbi:DUF3267 domain-containing protein [Bacillus kexueae]|uniref:DUF3267 domain-containing protein n=1 Tax=Aeribacillus kexueae TaxID=2078952 RepID=UPI001FAEDA02|nr:DUF3267 domain-containing protein [Bacillus kexueae]